MNETEEKPIHILLVEDEKAHVELSRIGLAESKQHIDCHAVQTLRQARRFIEKEKPDLIIADLNLPDGKGIELLPPPEERFNHPPCVVMTSYGNE
jgi:two-component system response regulator PilR (NtrC family)